MAAIPRIVYNSGSTRSQTIHCQSKTPHRPISVSGGDYKKFYLSGYLRSEAPAYTTDDGGQNAECYISGGRFGEETSVTSDEQTSFRSDD